MDLGLKGKRVIVTGATKGIGLSIARTFAAEGADVGICARTASDVEATVALLKGYGVRAFGEAVDVADTGAVRGWVASMGEQLGGVDTYVSNVSALGHLPDEETWRRSIEIDIMGVVAGCDAVMQWLEQSRGSIVLINTTGSVQVFGPPTPYPAVKAAMLAHMKYLANAMAPKGVRVNTVSPGSIYFEGGLWARRKLEEPERYERMLSLNPMGRFGKPEEIANAVVFLASEVSAFTTGANLVVDGASSSRIQN
jgi:3-oxoacyl-[acyl-carrier protein] reductase